MDMNWEGQQYVTYYKKPIGSPVKKYQKMV